MKNRKNQLIVLALFILNFKIVAQEHPPLHVSNEWEECSFQLSPSLTTSAWKQFTREGGLASYYRSLTDAGPLGKGRFELSLMQFNTRINETDDAWNHTFVHPHPDHWLVGGPRLPIPGLSLKVGISENIDAGIYWTTNPKANYSIAGAQIQRRLFKNPEKGYFVSGRLNYSTIYGPRDLTFSNYGMDIVASKVFNLHYHWLSLSPYIVSSVFVSHTHERTAAVDLEDQILPTFQGALGGVLQVSVLRIACEYNHSLKSTLSYRVGLSFNVNGKKHEEKKFRNQ